MLHKYNINNIRFLSMEIFSIGLKFMNSAQNSVLIVYNNVLMILLYSRL